MSGPKTPRPGLSSPWPSSKSEQQLREALYRYGPNAEVAKVIPEQGGKMTNERRGNRGGSSGEQKK